MNALITRGICLLTFTTLSVACGTGHDVYKSQTVQLAGKSTAIVSLDCKPIVEYIGYELVVRNVASRTDMEQALTFRVLKLGMDPPTIRRVRGTIGMLTAEVDMACDRSAAGVEGCDVYRDESLALLLRTADELDRAFSVTAVDGALKKASDALEGVTQAAHCR